MPEYELQQAYQEAIRFAGERHADQTMPASKASYLVHLSNVAMEVILAAKHSSAFDLEFAVQVALLHDVLEDTSTSFEEVAEKEPGEIITYLKDEGTRWVNDKDPDDDVTFVVIKVK